MGDSVHSLDKEEFLLPDERVLGDDTVLAFSAFAGV